jgi:U3 small nucleolar RNA-associated protein 21
MATASMNGDIALWNLEERRLFHVMKNAHDASIHTCSFYTSQSLLITASGDNSLKMWIFDSLDGIPRLLKSRSGHYKPPTKIRFYGSSGRVLLSAGQDQTLRHFSLIRDAQNVELSQGSLKKKSRDLQVSLESLRVPCITDFESNEIRVRDWDNILTCHSNENKVRSWSLKRKAMGQHILVPKDGSTVKAVTMSACGHFGLIGSAQGNVERFNMQSGLLRMTYKGHSKAITGILCDAVNRLLFTSSLDKTLKIFDFQKGDLVESLEFDSCVERMTIHRESGLLALATDDLLIHVVDLETRKIIRRFEGHEGRITDLAFSPDGRWLVSSSVDGSIKTWDLPSAYLIDSLVTPHLPTSIAFSPLGDFLVSTHVGQLGLFVWSNRSLFESIPMSRLSLEDEEVAEETRQALPVAIGQEQELESPNSDDDEGSAKEEVLVSPLDKDGTSFKTQDEGDWQDMNESMIRLSSLAKTKWQNLLHLDQIKKRNKPREAPKVPEKAPFFLKSLPGVERKFVRDDDDDDFGPSGELEENSRIGGLKSSKTRFSILLLKCAEKGDYSEFLDFLKTLSPSSIDFEIRSLQWSIGEGEEDDHHEELEYFLDALIQKSLEKRDFELIQAYLAVFIKVRIFFLKVVSRERFF